MTWLLVLSGNWGFADHTRTMRSFPAGFYPSVDEETQDFVRRASTPQLILGEGEPPEYAYVLPKLGDPYQPGHLRILHDSRIVLADPVVVEEIAEQQGDDRSLTYPCPECGAQFPHAAPLARHRERSHARPVESQPNESDSAEAEPPEMSLTDA